MDDHNWTIINIQIVCCEGNFIVEEGVDAELMSCFEIELFCFNCFIMTSLHYNSRIESQSFLLMQNAYDHKDGTKVCKYELDPVMNVLLLISHVDLS